MAYRPYRFVLWKSAEDAESGAPPHLQLIVRRLTHSHLMIWMQETRSLTLLCGCAVDT